MAIYKDTLIYRILRKTKNSFNWLLLPDSSAILYSRVEKNRRHIESLLDKIEMVLDVGSGNRPVAGFKKVIKMDFASDCTVDVRADVHQMPFQEKVFDLVWLGGVVEHFRNPAMAIGQIHRALKSGGYIYIEIPFLQRVHGAPHDYQRFTIAGLEELCSQFSRIKSGVISGPSSAFAHITRAYLALCMSFGNRYIYHFFYYYILGWVTLPIKYLDVVLAYGKDAEAISFDYFYLGKKV